jgi:hypothetical protein
MKTDKKTIDKLFEERVANETTMEHTNDLISNEAAKIIVEFLKYGASQSYHALAIEVLRKNERFKGADIDRAINNLRQTSQIKTYDSNDIKLMHYELIKND